MSSFTILFVADICGRPGRQAAAHLVKALKEEYAADYVVTNIENAAGGFGITPRCRARCFTYGIDVQTSGNHIWIESRCWSISTRTPGFCARPIIPARRRARIFCGAVGLYHVGVLNLMGRVFMANIDCPFRTAIASSKRCGRKPRSFWWIFTPRQRRKNKRSGIISMVGCRLSSAPTLTSRQRRENQPSRHGLHHRCRYDRPHDSIIGMEKGPSLGRFLTALRRDSPPRWTMSSCREFWSESTPRPGWRGQSSVSAAIRSGRTSEQRT